MQGVLGKQHKISSSLVASQKGNGRWKTKEGEEEEEEQEEMRLSLLGRPKQCHQI